MGKFYFETLLTDYGALFDKLLFAFVWKEDYNPEDRLRCPQIGIVLITILQLLKNPR